MAGNIKGLTIEIGGDTTKLGKALESVQKKSKDLSGELGQINRLLKMDPGNADLLAQKQRVLAEAVANTKEKLEVLRAASEQAAKSADKYDAWKAKYDPLQAEIDKVSQKLKDLKASQAEMEEVGDVNSEAYQALQAEINETSGTLKGLRKQVQDVNEEFGNPASPEQLRELQREVVGTKKKLEGYEKAVQETAEASQDLGKDTEKAEKGLDETGDEAKKSAKEVDKFADAADKAEKSGGGLGSTLGNIAVGGLKVVGAAAGAAITGLTAAAESTREYRTEMGKLDAAFTTSGHSSEAATSTYKALQGVLGETDQAVEAANNLAKLCDSEEDLAKWSGDILPGVFATFGASLPVEGLAEAANESARVGAVCGPLADALNWAAAEGETFGVTMKENTWANREWNEAVKNCTSAEDYFNLALSQCSTEQERQALITSTLSGLYGDAAEAYKETNAEVIRANEANEAWTSSLAGVGGAIDPIITDVKTMGASLLTDLVPGVQQLAESFRGLLNGDTGAAAGVGDALSGMITGLLGKITEMAPSLATAAVSLVTSLTTSLISMLPQIITVGVEVVMALIQGLTTAIPQITQAIVGMIPQLVQALVTGIPQLIQGAVQFLLAIVQAIPQILPYLVAALPQLVMSIVNALVAAVPQLIDGALQFLLAIVEAIPQLVPLLVAAIPQITTTLALALLDAVPQLLDAAVTLLLAIVEAIPQIVVELIGALPQIWNTMRNYFSQLPGKLWAILSSLVTNFVRWAAESRAKALQGAADILSAIANTLQNLPGRVGAFLSQVISNVASWATNLAAKGKAAASRLVSAVVDTVKGIPGKIANVGRNLVEGIWNGISGATTWIKNKISSWVGDVTTFLKNLFGIQSPSTVMRDEIGRYLPQGIGVGIEKDGHYATDALAALSDDMVAAADPELGGLSFERELNYTNKINGPASAIAQSNAALLAKLDGIYERLGRLQVVLDSGATVGGLIDGIDSALSTRQILRARGV